MPRPPRILTSAAFFLLGLALAPGARAAVVVITNHTNASIDFLVRQGATGKYHLESGDLVTVPVKLSGEIKIAFNSAGNPLKYELEPNTIYNFSATRLGGLSFKQVPLGVDTQIATLRQALRPAALAAEIDKLPALAEIPVKILVDEEERMARPAWEARLRKRFEQASEIFEKHCRMRFKVVACDTWDSDDSINEFNRSLVEFEREVTPAPGRLVVGFTSQYEPVVGPIKLGGTRAAFYPYILIREWPRFHSEPERLEVLVHELGHYLGAAHSPDADSVMRPMLGDRKARLKSFRIGVDPVNTLALFLIGEEYRAKGNIRRLVELSPATRLELFCAYNEIANTLPDDPAGLQYRGLLGNIPMPDPRSQIRLRINNTGNSGPAGAPTGSVEKPRPTAEKPSPP